MGTRVGAVPLARMWGRARVGIPLRLRYPIVDWCWGVCGREAPANGVAGFGFRWWPGVGVFVREAPANGGDWDFAYRNADGW